MNKSWTEAEYLEWCKKWGFTPHVTMVGATPVSWKHGEAGTAIKRELLAQRARFEKNGNE